MVINTRLGEMDEGHLQKRVSVIENVDQRVEAVEYCLLGCDGSAHRTGEATGDGCFCEHHVHRSVHAVMKRWPHAIATELQSFG